MFALFERYLQPTAVPEHPEPPDGLVAFLWHFARQAKWLFVALFVVEFFVALTDSAVPWFMGRIVTLVTTVAPERFLAETWPLARRHGAGGAGRAARHRAAALSHHQPGDRRRRSPA